MINGVEREAISHEVDHVKDFGKYKLRWKLNGTTKTLDMSGWLPSCKQDSRD